MARRKNQNGQRRQGGQRRRPPRDEGMSTLFWVGLIGTGVYLFTKKSAIAAPTARVTVKKQAVTAGRQAGLLAGQVPGGVNLYGQPFPGGTEVPNGITGGNLSGDPWGDDLRDDLLMQGGGLTQSGPGIVNPGGGNVPY